jgi:tetratricopeptide (TPR) repeat protein
MEQEAEAEKHLRQANLLRMRGELKQSLEELVKAIDANPYDPAPHSLSADILRNVGRPDDAVKEYEIAKELSAPGAAQAAIEAKLARLVIEQNELNGGDVNALGISPPPLYRSGISTVIASAIVPGLGQMIVGQHVKAALLFLAWIAPTAVFFMPNGPKIHFGQTVQPVIFFLGTIGAASWLASIIDSVAEIKRAQSTKAER